MAAASASRLLDLALDEAALARLSRLGVLQGTDALGLGREGANDGASLLPLDWPELERVLPDRGLPRGVVEIASPMSKLGGTVALRGGATTVALSAIRAAHAADERAWCAWVTEANAPALYAPALVQAGVDLDRLLVVRPEHAALARTVVKVGGSGAFDVVVVDAAAGLDGRVPGVDPEAAPGDAPPARGSSRPASRASSRPRVSRVSRVDGSVVVRKLALASEEKGTAFLLLTNMYAARPVPWPVALRMEVERRPDALAVRVTKDRRGRASSQHVVRLAG